MKRYWRLVKYGLRHWPTLILILGLTAAMSALTALLPWPIKLLVDHAFSQTALPEPLDWIFQRVSLSPTPAVLVGVAALGSLGLFFLNSALEVGVSWCWTAAGQRMVYDLAADLFHRLQRLSLLFHSRRTVGDSLSRLTADTWCVYTVTQNLLISPVGHLFTIAVIGVVAWNLDRELAALFLLAAPALGGCAFFFGRRIKRRAGQSREIQSRLVSFVHQTLSALPAVQAFGTESANARRFRRLAGQAVEHARKASLLKNTEDLAAGLTMTLGAALILYVGGSRVLSGALSLGSLLVFVAYLRSVEGSARCLLGAYSKLKSVEPSMDRVLEVLETDEQVRDAPDARTLPASPAGQRGYVRFEAVTFGYQPDRPVLHAISLEARPGETLALVGPSGAGKSTLVSLIPRFFDPWHGRVSFDGHDLRSVQLASLRSQVALVLQEPFLLPLSVAENIAYGRPNASLHEIEAAARAANAHDFIQRLPDGYDSLVGERGATLSVGQRQRLAIARALLKDAPVLILDEPTAALDAEAEDLLLQALDRLMHRRTTFIIAHRLSTIRHADRIIALHDGRIADAGTHHDLLARNGLYARLHHLQLGAVGEVVA
jgi:ATP-binding cassette, subfamily B, bacterial